MEFKLESVDKKFYRELFEWRSDSYAIQHNPFDPCDYELFVQKMDSYSSQLSQIYDGNDRRWVILKDDIILSILGLSAINKMMKTAMIGYQVNPSMRGQGIGTKAVFTLVEGVFRSTDIRKLIATIADQNIPSYKIAERVGFQQEGLLRKHFLINGTEVDQRIYGIMRDEAVRPIS